jgi:hypothetical protein
VLGALSALPGELRTGGRADSLPLRARLMPPTLPAEDAGATEAALPAPVDMDDASASRSGNVPDVASLRPSADTPERLSPAPIAQAGFISTPKYYAVEELDQRPLVQVSVEPKFPQAAPGEVRHLVLQLYVNEFGRVDDVRIEASGFLDGPFEASAREAFAAARFVPGVRNGIAVKSLLRIEVRFGEPLPVDTLPQGDGRPERIVIPTRRGSRTEQGTDR